MIYRLYIAFLSLLLLCYSAKGQQTIGLFENDSLAFNGYTLFSPISFTTTYLIDNCGRAVHEWPNHGFPGLLAYLLEDGNLLRARKISNTTFSSGGGGGGRMELIDWDNNLLWQYDYSDNTHFQHHDIEPMPNGNILVLAWEYRSAAETTQAGRDPSKGSGVLWPTQIVEIEPVGNDSATVIWEWHLWDHLIQEYDSTKSNYGTVADHPELVDINHAPNPSIVSDWIHANSVDYNEELDQIILNSRNFNEFWVIDHSTTTTEAASHTGGNAGKGGDILYRWGNPQTYGRGTEADRKFFLQHDAHWIPDGLPNAGKIMIFNNGQGRPTGNASSVEIIDPPIDGNGIYADPGNAAHLPLSPSWIYPSTLDPNFYSHNISGAQQLPNGNVLICAGASGHFFEVNEMSEIVWDYINPVGFGPLSQGNMPNNNTAFRIHRYGTDYQAFVGRDLTAGEVIEANPYPSNCTIFDPNTAVDNFFSDREIVCPSMLSSNYLPVTNRTNQDLVVEIFDVNGRVLYKDSFSNSYFRVPMKNFYKGVFFIRFSNPQNRQFLTKKLIKI